MPVPLPPGGYQTAIFEGLFLARAGILIWLIVRPSRLPSFLPSFPIAAIKRFFCAQLEIIHLFMAGRWAVIGEMGKFLS